MAQPVPSSVPFRTAVIYQDNRRALEWLEKAFGFEVSLVVADENGKIGHAQMSFGGGIIYVGNEWSESMRSPKSIGGKNTQFLHVHLDSGVDAHCEHARKAGAVITQEPTDQFYGDRSYRCLDHEGHLWTFGQTMKTMSLDEMAKSSGNQFTLREKL
jgi:uncharacterized glyoxalase superfamily protein PhnB